MGGHTNVPVAPNRFPVLPLLAWEACKAPYQDGNLIRGGVQGEMTAVEDMDLGGRHIPAVGLRLGGGEREFIGATRWK